MKPALRRATPEDAAAIASLHTASWRAAYRDIVDDGFLAGPLLAERQKHWQSKLATLRDGDYVQVIPAPDGTLLGFIAMWVGEQDGYDGFVDNLHVAPASRGQGLGAVLLSGAGQHLRALGLASGYLWVLDQNQPAYRFYLRHGAIAAEQRRAEFGGRILAETRMAWADLGCVVPG